MSPKNYHYVHLPDCCLMCRFGERYYGSIRCNLGGDVHFFGVDGNKVFSIDVHGICDSFEREAE